MKNVILEVELELNPTTEPNPTNAERDVFSHSVVMLSLMLMRSVILEPPMEPTLPLVRLIVPSENAVMENLTTKLLIEPRKLVMMEISLTTMDAQASAKLNVVMDGLPELRNVIWELTMPTLPTSANSTADSQDVVMDTLISMRNVTQLPQVTALPLADLTVRPHTVVMESLMPPEVKNVMLVLTTTISQQLDVPLVAHKTLVEPSDPQTLETSIEPWPAQDAFTHMLDLPPDHHAQDPSNGWLLNQSKRFLNYKLINSNTSSELESEEVNEEIANSLIPFHSELVTVFPPLDQLPLLPELPAHLFPESPLFKQLSIFSAETPLPPQSSNKPLPLLFPSWLESH